MLSWGTLSWPFWLWRAGGTHSRQLRTSLGFCDLTVEGRQAVQTISTCVPDPGRMLAGTCCCFLSCRGPPPSLHLSLALDPSSQVEFGGRVALSLSAPSCHIHCPAASDLTHFFLTSTSILLSPPLLRSKCDPAEPSKAPSPSRTRSGQTLYGGRISGS